ncbi:MAG: cupredoxin domain-containing protein [bacterium]
MLRSKTLLVVALGALLGLASCGQEQTSLQTEEYVPGIKRWSGPYHRIVEPSVKPHNPLGRPDVTITVDAFTSEFNPNVIRVKQNQVVKLVLKGTDDGDLPKITGVKEFSGHGFHVLGPYDIWITGLRAGVTREIIFKATVAGEFDFECPVFCGLKHAQMRGKLIVEPS